MATEHIPVVEEVAMKPAICREVPIVMFECLFLCCCLVVSVSKQSRQSWRIWQCLGTQMIITVKQWNSETVSMVVMQRQARDSVVNQCHKIHKPSPISKRNETSRVVSELRFVFGFTTPHQLGHVPCRVSKPIQDELQKTRSSNPQVLSLNV